MLTPDQIIITEMPCEQGDIRLRAEMKVEGSVVVTKKELDVFKAKLHLDLRRAIYEAVFGELRERLRRLQHQAVIGCHRSAVVDPYQIQKDFETILAMMVVVDRPDDESPATCDLANPSLPDEV